MVTENAGAMVEFLISGPVVEETVARTQLQQDASDLTYYAYILQSHVSVCSEPGRTSKYNLQKKISTEISVGQGIL